MFFSGISDEAGKPLDIQIKAHKELGWTHMELRNIEGTNFTDISDEKFEECVGKLSDANMTVSCFASQLCNWARKITNPLETDIEELNRAIPRMQKLGTSFIRIMSYPNDGWSETDWKEEALKRIKRLSEIAADGGIILAHENCSGWAGENPENSLEMIERVGSDSLKLIYDTGNVVEHKQDPIDFYKKVREHIVYIHIKDGILTDEDKCRFTYPGEGDGKVKEVVSGLLSSGYDGGFSIEPHLSSIIHEGKQADNPNAAYETYIEYGKRLEKLVRSAQ